MSKSSGTQFKPDQMKAAGFSSKLRYGAGTMPGGGASLMIRWEIEVEDCCEEHFRKIVLFTVGRCIAADFKVSKRPFLWNSRHSLSQHTVFINGSNGKINGQLNYCP